MDDFTKKHFAAWCDAQGLTDDARAALVEEFGCDPAYWSDRSYWQLLDCVYATNHAAAFFD
jgi:hypothetical protein